VQKFGLFATIIGLGGDGLVPISTLGAERFAHHDEAVMTRATSIGMILKLRSPKPIREPAR